MNQIAGLDSWRHIEDMAHEADQLAKSCAAFLKDVHADIGSIRLLTDIDRYKKERDSALETIAERNRQLSESVENYDAALKELAEARKKLSESEADKTELLARFWVMIGELKGGAVKKRLGEIITSVSPTARKANS